MSLAVLSAQPATVAETLTVFFGYALLAVFAQNAIFTRALGVSRLVQLVGDARTNSLLFGLLQCVTQLLLAPVAWYAGNAAASWGLGPAARPLVYLGCIAAVSAVEMALLHLIKLPWQRQLLRILPLAALNSCVLGTLLLGRTQSFTLTQSLGFGLGSGVGYLLAVLLGAGLGVAYDLMRTLRRRVRLPLLGPALDLLFWVLATVGLFLYTILRGGGELRLYTIAALLLGGCVYFWLLSPPVLLLTGLAAGLAARLLRLAAAPLLLLAGTVKKIREIIKRHFHYRRKWFNIKMIPEEMERSYRQEAAGKGGRAHVPHQKSGAADQDRDLGAAHLHGHRPAGPAGADPAAAGAEGEPGPAGSRADPGQRRPGRRRGRSRRPGPGGGDRPG